MYIYWMAFFLIVFLGILYKEYGFQPSIERNNVNFSSPTQNKNNRYLIIIGAMLIIIMGLKDASVGVDINQYKYLYENSQYFYEIRYNKTEVGFYIVLYFFHDLLGLNFQWFLIIVSSLCVYSLFKTIQKYSCDHLVSIILYLTVGTFTMNMSGLRQTIAMSLILLTIPLALKKKYIRFFILVGIAYTFHNTAIIFAPSYFLFNKRFGKRLCAFLLLISVSSLLFRSYLLPLFQLLSPERYGKYIEYVHNSYVNPLVILVPIVFFIFELLFVPIEKDGKYSIVNSFCFVFSAIALLMRILSLNEPSIGRLGYYFFIGDIILVPQALLGIEMSNSVKTRRIVGGIIVILCCSYFIISTPGGGLHIDEYRFFWQSIS